MGLDIAIVDRAGVLIRSTPLGVDEHWELMGLVAGRRMPMVSRLNDYYEDADYAPEEVSELRAELVQVESMRPSARLLQRLKAIEALLAEASNRKQGVSAIAD